MRATKEPNVLQDGKSTVCGQEWRETKTTMEQKPGCWDVERSKATNKSWWKHVGGLDGTNWEIRIDAYKLPCVKQIAAGRNLLYSTESSARYSDSLDGWNEELEVRTKREGDICIHILLHFIVWWKLTQHCKAIIKGQRELVGEGWQTHGTSRPFALSMQPCNILLRFKRALLAVP